MKIIKQSWQWASKPPNNTLELIEQAGRTCYKSEEKITRGSAVEFAKSIMKSGHESVIEHVSASVRFITNRGVTHELVRHRLAAYSQESTRYVNYKNRDMEFIEPVWIRNVSIFARELFVRACEDAEESYKCMIGCCSCTPQQAREVLPNALKTEIVVTANLREWRHIFRLRTSKASHPQMVALMLDCLQGFKAAVPVIFDDI